MSACMTASRLIRVLRCYQSEKLTLLVELFAHHNSSLSFFYYYAYTWLRSVWLRYKTGHKIGSKAVALPVLEELAVGFIAGITSRAISTPMNLITVQMQKDNPEDEQELNITSVIKEIYHRDGLKGFWRGELVVNNPKEISQSQYR